MGRVRLRPKSPDPTPPPALVTPIQQAACTGLRRARLLHMPAVHFASHERHCRALAPAIMMSRSFDGWGWRDMVVKRPTISCLFASAGRQKPDSVPGANQEPEWTLVIGCTLNILVLQVTTSLVSYLPRRSSHRGFTGRRGRLCSDTSS